MGGHSPYPRHMVDNLHHAERMPADSSSEAFSFDENHPSRTDFARSETTLGQVSNYPQTPIGQAVSFDFDLNNLSVSTSKVPTLHGRASDEAITPINREPRVEKSDPTAVPPVPETPPKAKINARELLFIITVCMAQFLTLGGLGQSVAPLFIIGKDLGVAPTDLGTMSWYTAAFSLTVGAFILPAGEAFYSICVPNERLTRFRSFRRYVRTQTCLHHRLDMVCLDLNHRWLQLCSKDEWFYHAQRHTRLSGDRTRDSGAECHGARRYHISYGAEAQYGLLGVRCLRSHWFRVRSNLFCPIVAVCM